MGYRLSDVPHRLDSKVSISVPFIEGDANGQLLSAIANQLIVSPRVAYQKSKGDYLLIGKIKKIEKKRIGYQYDVRESSGDLINRLVPNEGRQTLYFEYQVVSASDQEVAFGPYLLEAFAEYDYVNFDTFRDLSFVDDKGRVRSVLSFSLGQLDSPEGARTASLSFVYQRLAETLLKNLETSFL